MTSRLVQTFLDFVRIPSESGQEEQFLAYLAQSLSDEFGAECRRDSYGNLIARIAGNNSTSSAPLLLGTHGDTVAPGRDIKPILDDGVIRSDGSTVLGADDKAGIAELFEALRRAERHPPLEIIVTRKEEQGIQGARHLDYSLLSARHGYVLDMDSVDSIVIGGPTKLNLQITVRGRSAHAGMEPEKGISAITAAARAIARAPDGRLDEQTTCNIGTIRGGENRNSVPESVFIEAEARSLDHARCLSVAEQIRSAFEEEAASVGATAEIEVTTAYRAVGIPEESRVVRVAAAAIEAAGLSPRIFPVVGGTDATVYNENGIQTAVLGIGVRAEHTRNEHIYVTDMEKAVEILLQILDQYAQE